MDVVELAGVALLLWSAALVALFVVDVVEVLRHP
jgi:hypothetical protein